MRVGEEGSVVPGFWKSTPYLAVSRSYSMVESVRRTTTRSIQLLGNRSQACQSIIQPPCLTSSSIESNNYLFEEARVSQVRVRYY